MTKKIEITEEQLVFALKSKSTVAFEILYDRYSALIYGVILKIVNNVEFAEDATQEVFVKIYKNIENFDFQKARLSTWLISIARNTALDVIKSKNYQQSSKNQNVEDIVNIVDGQKQSQVAVDTIDVKKNISRISPELQVLVDLFYFKAYTQQDIADELGMPLGTVKTKMRKALEELRKYYLEKS
ncbi:MAG: sigma-70 family RNA polymerase sigma factor [Bacteroidota bacterium]